VGEDLYNDGIPVDRVAAAYSAGYAAYHAHCDQERNPYPYKSILWRQWLEGFERAYADTKESD